MLRRLHSASDELLHLDFLRLIASCGIVLLHFARFLSPGTRGLLGPVGGMTLFVDMFFVISGFVIAYVYAGRLNGWAAYGTFLQRRVARLGPLHWATLLVFLAVGVLVWTGRMGSEHLEVYDPRCLLPNALAIHAWGVCDNLSFNDVSWSISAEMGMYIVAPVLLFMASRSAAGLAVGAIAAIVALSFAPRQPWLEWASHFGVARALPSFALGVVLLHWRGALVRMPAPRAVAVAAFVLLLVGVRLEIERLVLLPLVYAVVAAAIAADLGGRYRPLRIGALGQLTYSLYMIHPIVRTFLIGFVGRRVLKLDGWAADAMVVAGFAATFVLAYLSFVLFETPARRWLSRPRREPPAAAF
jgi:peptidoglycan/LPS O-acetylase OafA/YrhL